MSREARTKRGRRALSAGKPRLLGRHNNSDGRSYGRVYAALEESLGPFGTKLLRLEAGRTAVCWVNLEIATRALAEARRAREQGRGRRPNARDLERLSRRQGLADGSYSQALDKLRELAASNGRGKAPSLGAYLADKYGHEGRAPR